MLIGLLAGRSRVGHVLVTGSSMRCWSDVDGVVSRTAAGTCLQLAAFDPVLWLKAAGLCDGIGTGVPVVASDPGHS